MDRKSAFAAIHSFLSILPHIGHSGFEGFAANLCPRRQVSAFRLSCSGFQVRQDAKSEPGDRNLVRIEAKHHSKATLELRELTVDAFVRGADFSSRAFSVSLCTAEPLEIAEV